MAIFLSDPDYNYVLSLLHQCQSDGCDGDRAGLLAHVIAQLTKQYEYSVTRAEIPFKPIELMFRQHLWIPDDTQFGHFSGSFWAVGWIKLHAPSKIATRDRNATQQLNVGDEK